MNRTEHLLTVLAEECDEVGQRVCKALRFSLGEIQNNNQQNPFLLSNAMRISQEMTDLYATAMKLVDEGIIPDFRDPHEVLAKQNKIEHYMDYARNRGSLEDGRD